MRPHPAHPRGSHRHPPAARGLAVITRRILALVPALLLATAGCDDPLAEEPRTFLSNEQFFRDATDAQAAVLATYQPFQDIEYYRVRFVSNVMQFEDAVDGRGTYAPGAQYACDQVCMQRLWNSWANMYRGINRANLVVARVPAIDMDSARKAAFVGEAKFVRALNYVNLVRYWGPVPLRLEPSEGFDKLAAPRAPVDEVYRQIAADLRDAEAVLPDAAPNGRATRWAAKALLAEVHLGRGEWPAAAAKAKEVIDSRRFSLVEVRTAADFDQLFGPEVDTSPEELFDVPFTRDAGFGSELPALLHHPSAGYATNAYRALFGNMRSFLGRWSPTDLRYQYGLYTGTDTRHLSSTEPQRFKKFRDARSIERSAHGNDFHVLRYADVLTTFAEAESQANGGPTPAAYDAINRVRRRAYGLSTAAPSAARDLPPGLSAQAFRDAVLLERAYEFTAEGRRYWDLKRTGTLEAAIRAVGKAYDPRYLLWPIPQDELDANDALTLQDQNPGW